ncbi:uncharacterized protein PAC_17102 [Phialocephala subalpina]|uniref:Uncharacterized protein n=1 Tax=Phialocephala subalpina TaxID=576137 RepID=A0A1L7XQ89_9HELO|nr:uncharacterized protein PAC_17102 [Phialocephala subalpina]
MSLRSSHRRGSQVLECTSEASHPTGSERNTYMSKQDERLTLRLLSPKDAPSEGRRALASRNGGRRTGGAVATRRKDTEQTSEPLPSPATRKHEKHTPERISDGNLPKSPDTGQTRPTSPQSYASTPKDVSRPVMGLPNMPPPRWELATPSQALVTLSDTTLGLSPGLETQKFESRPEWQEIQKLRADVWNLRSQIHQMRASLRVKQEVKSAADDILFRRITYMTARGLNLTDSSSSPFPGQKSLMQLMDDCQEARNEYGPLEDDCNRLEDRVSQQEFRLARLEDHFFAKLKESQSQPSRPPPPSLLNVEHSASSSIASDDDDDDFEPSEYHPLVNDYLSKLGDLDLMQERLDEFRDEKAALEAEKQSRHRFGLTLDADDQEWLDDAETEHAEIIGKIHSLEKELEILKRKCLSKNLIDEDGEPTSFQSQEESYFVEEDMDPRDHNSEYVKYPLLLPQPGRKHGRQFESRPDVASETATTRINEWLLNKLRISPLDVNLLASTFETQYRRTPKDWQFRVLKVWYEDGTAGSITSPGPVPAASHSSMSTKHPDETSHSSDLSQEHMRGSIHVLLSSSSRPASEVSDDTERAFGTSKLQTLTSLRGMPWGGT